MILGLLGEDPSGAALDGFFEGKSVRGRPLQVKRGGTLQEVEPCDILLIAPSERDRLPALLEGLGQRKTLTVSEIEGFAKAGGMLEIALSGGLIRFRVNAKAAERAGLRISSKILSLGQVVRGRKSQGQDGR